MRAPDRIVDIVNAAGDTVDAIPRHFVRKGRLADGAHLVHGVFGLRIQNERGVLGVVPKSANNVFGGRLAVTHAGIRTAGATAEQELLDCISDVEDIKRRQPNLVRLAEGYYDYPKEGYATYATFFYDQADRPLEAGANSDAVRYETMGMDRVAVRIASTPELFTPTLRTLVDLYYQQSFQ